MFLLLTETDARHKKWYLVLEFSVVVDGKFQYNMAIAKFRALERQEACATFYKGVLRHYVFNVQSKSIFII